MCNQCNTAPPKTGQRPQSARASGLLRRHSRTSLQTALHDKFNYQPLPLTHFPCLISKQVRTIFSYAPSHLQICCCFCPSPVHLFISNMLIYPYQCSPIDTGVSNRNASPRCGRDALPTLGRSCTALPPPLMSKLALPAAPYKRSPIHLVCR